MKVTSNNTVTSATLPRDTIFPHIFNSFADAEENFGKYSRKFLLYDQNIPGIFKDHLMRLVSPYSSYPVYGGEDAKSIRTYEDVQKWLMLNGAKGSDHLVVLGGGTLSDLGGFVAATYHRGMKLILIPSTLLSMVDASIGGKNGVNFCGIKNMIGTLYQPEAIFIFPELLTTLSHQELLQGCVEMYKHALLDSFDHLEQIEELLRCWDKNLLVKLIERSARYKVKVVEESVVNPEIRHQLNFGHTFGHAIESVVSPKCTHECAHGGAVFLGMMFELMYGVQQGITDPVLYERIRSLIPIFKPILPKLDQQSFESVYGAMCLDKKSAHHEVRLFCLRDVGEHLGLGVATRKSLKQVWDTYREWEM